MHIHKWRQAQHSAVGRLQLILHGFTLGFCASGHTNPKHQAVVCFYSSSIAQWRATDHHGALVCCERVQYFVLEILSSQHFDEILL